jgi:DNA-binding CsgD family transcriptional regulator
MGIGRSGRLDLESVMIVVRCIRCQITTTIVDQTVRSCTNCGGALFPLNSPQPRGPQTAQQAVRQTLGPATQADQEVAVPPATAASPRTSRVLEAAHGTLESSSGFNPAATLKQPKKAYCPGCGAPAIVNDSTTHDEHGEFQLTCNTCHSCWNLKLTAPRHALAPPQFSERGDSRQASTAHLTQISGAGVVPCNPSQLLTLLTERQKEVMDLVVAGKANKQTAHILGLSEKTVERHRANLMRRLGVRNVVDLVRLHLLTTGQIENPAASATNAGPRECDSFTDQRSD